MTTNDDKHPLSGTFFKPEQFDKPGHVYVVTGWLDGSTSYFWELRQADARQEAISLKIRRPRIYEVALPEDVNALSFDEVWQYIDDLTWKGRLYPARNHRAKSNLPPLEGEVVSQ